MGRADYRAFLTGVREHYLLIDYISPLNWRNRRVLASRLHDTNLRTLSGGQVPVALSCAPSAAALAV